MIAIERVVGLAFVQDLGRPGHMHEGIPCGGALVPERLARANAAVGNAIGAAGIERFGAMTLVAQGDLVIAEDGGAARGVRAGERVDLGWDGSVRARYLAVRGGLDVPVVLGGRGTLIVAGLGGHQGRALRRGDVLAVGAQTEAETVTVAVVDDRSPIAVLPGPDAGAYAPGALAALVARPWRLSVRSDRTGTRLEGAAIPWADDAPAARTTPMIAGAIELPPSGEPIVLGPDHPTTGGYPVVALIAARDLGRFHTIALGREVRFARAARGD